MRKYFEDRVRAAIGSGEMYEPQGLVTSIELARAMAYAAKPYIDQALQDLQSEPCSIRTTYIDAYDRPATVFVPGLRTDAGAKTYTDIQASVEYGHQQASRLEIE